MTKTLRLALIRNFRAVPTTAPGDSTAFEKPELTRHGFYSLELPRGFPEQGETRGEAAARETREELGVGVGEVLFLGWCNCNTAMFMTDVPVFVVCVRKEVCVDDEKDEGEAIANVEWVELEEAVRRVAHGEIRCGMTLSGLMYAVAMREKIAAFVTGEIDGVGEVKG